MHGERCAKLGRRSPLLALRRQQPAEISSRLDVVGPERNSATVVFKRLGWVASELQHGGEIIVSLGMLGVDSQRLAKACNRFVTPALQRKRVSKVVVSRG